MNLPLTAPTLYVCANLATEKKMLKNELHEAQVVYNLLRYTANKPTSKICLAATMPAAMAMAQSEPATNHLARGLGFDVLQTQWVLRKSNPTSLSGSIPPRS